MNKPFVNIIYKHLALGIDEGYKTGIQSIVKLNKKNFTDSPLLRGGDTPIRRGGVGYNFNKKQKLFKVDYTKADKEAIRNFKINAYKVAGVGSYQLEEELKKLGVEVLESRLPDYDSFELAVRQKMLQYGIGLGDQPPSGWLKQNLDHAIKSSLQGARWIRVNDPELKGLYTAWVYHTQQDSRVRPEHLVLEGRVFRYNDPAAAGLYPPNDWGCRCYDEPVTADESGDMNIETNSKSLLKEVPEDFRFNPGISQDIWGRWLQQNLKDMPAGEVAQLKQMLKNEFS